MGIAEGSYGEVGDNGLILMVFLDYAMGIG
jgi:hypothetical protein